MSYRLSMRGDVVFGPWLTLAPMQQQRCNASECRPSWGVSTHPARRYIRGVPLAGGFNGNRTAIRSHSIISRLYGVSSRPAAPTYPCGKGDVCEGLRRARQACISNPVLSLLKCIAPPGPRVAASCTGNRCIVARCPVGQLDVAWCRNNAPRPLFMTRCKLYFLKLLPRLLSHGAGACHFFSWQPKRKGCEVHERHVHHARGSSRCFLVQ